MEVISLLLEKGARIETSNRVLVLTLSLLSIKLHTPSNNAMLCCAMCSWIVLEWKQRAA
jgi:hypothetical protein